MILPCNTKFMNEKRNMCVNLLCTNYETNHIHNIIKTVFYIYEPFYLLDPFVHKIFENFTIVTTLDKRPIRYASYMLLIHP